MIRAELMTLALVWFLVGLFIVIRPQDFYAVVPGLDLMGPFNIHFIRDVGLAFVASGIMLGWGGYAKAGGIAFAALLWPLLHAAFHLQVWCHRGYPFDRIFAFDLVAVIAPPVVAMIAVWQMAAQTRGLRRD